MNRGEGKYVYDIDNNRYYDGLAAYGAVSQGHCNPKIMKVAIDQMQKLTLSSRAFYNENLGLAAEYITKLFKYDKVVFMNTGVEGGETSLKIARRYGYRVKKIEQNKAKIAFMSENFWGRTLAACGSSDDPERYLDFGPFP